MVFPEPCLCNTIYSDVTKLKVMPVLLITFGGEAGGTTLLMDWAASCSLEKTIY